MSIRKRLRRLTRKLRFRLGGFAEFQRQFRGRGLESLREVFGGPLLESELDRRREAPCSLLEIGCGHGRVLLELSEKYPALELHGLNRWKSAAISEDKSLEFIAKRFGLPAPGSRGKAPRLHFHDARKLRFDDASFDVVVSQVSLQHVERKDLVIEEVWRVLRPGGVALLNLDTTRADSPDLVAGETPRFIVYRDARRIPFSEFVAEVRARGFDVERSVVVSGKPGKEWTRANLVLRKTAGAPAALSLGLDLDRRSSFDLKRLKPKKGVSKHYWGFRSVFVAPPR